MLPIESIDDLCMHYRDGYFGLKTDDEVVPVRVRDFGGRNPTTRRQLEGIMLTYRMPDGRFEEKRIRDVPLITDIPPLGCVQVGVHTAYVTMRNTRQYKKGLHLSRITHDIINHSSVEYLLERMENGWEKFRAPQQEEVVYGLYNNLYSSYQDTYQRVAEADVFSSPFSKDFTISCVPGRQEFSLFYRRDEVGLCTQDRVLLFKDAEHLKESIEEFTNVEVEEE